MSIFILHIISRYNVSISIYISVIYLYYLNLSSEGESAVRVGDLRGRCHQEQGAEGGREVQADAGDAVQLKYWREINITFLIYYLLTTH